MRISNNKNRIDLFLEALERAFATTGEIAPWPIHIATIFPYFTDIEAADLFAKLKLISKEKQPLKILRRLQVGPSAVKALLMDLIVGLKVAKPAISMKERAWFVEYIFDILENMQSGDIFCREGRNLILTPPEVQKFYQETPWLWLESKESKQNLGRSIYKASASTKALIWSLYFYGWDDTGYEIHGPYEVAGDKGKRFRLVVTDYFDPKPTLLWKSIEASPYNSIRLLALYNEEADLSVDIFCHFVNKGNLLDTTAAIYLEANGVPIRTRERAEVLSSSILERVSRQHELIEAMNKREIIKKYIESRYYAFRKVRMYFGENWYPPKEIIQRIQDWKVIEIPESGGATSEDLKKAYDPRTDFVPS